MGSSARKSGFTLIELVMVIVILAIISSLAVPRMGSMRRNSARRVSIANQQAVGRAVETYLALNDGQGINRLDSLLDDETHDGDTNGFDFTTVSSDTVAGGLYLGPVVLGDGLTRAIVEEKNRGLHQDLVNVLCLYGVSDFEAQALNRLGLDYVMRHNTRAKKTPFELKKKGDDETIPQDTDGLDPELSACFARTVTEGMVFAAVSPTNNPGRAIYRDCGQELLQTHETGSENDYEATAKQDVRDTGGPLLAFGLGGSCSIIGKTEGGMDAAPYSETLTREYYRQYILLIRLRPRQSGDGTDAEFAGVLDPEGNTIRKARLLLK